MGPRRPKSDGSESHRRRPQLAVEKSEGLLIYGLDYLMCTPEMAREMIRR